MNQKIATTSSHENFWADMMPSDLIKGFTTRGKDDLHGTRYKFTCLLRNYYWWLCALHYNLVVLSLVFVLILVISAILIIEGFPPHRWAVC